MTRDSTSAYVQRFKSVAVIALIGLFCLGLGLIGFGIYTVVSGRMVGLILAAVGIPFAAIGGYFLWTVYLADVDWRDHSTDNTMTGTDAPDDDF